MPLLSALWSSAYPDWSSEPIPAGAGPGVHGNGARQAVGSIMSRDAYTSFLNSDDVSCVASPEDIAELEKAHWYFGYPAYWRTLRSAHAHLQVAKNHLRDFDASTERIPRVMHYLEKSDYDLWSLAYLKGWLYQGLQWYPFRILGYLLGDLDVHSTRMGLALLLRSVEQDAAASTKSLAALKRAHCDLLKLDAVDRYVVPVTNRWHEKFSLERVSSPQQFFR